jgi:succinyl-CoA synthetase beta subunit
MLRVNTLEELFSAAETLSLLKPPHKDRLVIITNGGGMGVLATDELLAQGGALAELSAVTLEKLDGVLPATWSRSNPIDIIGDAPPERFAAAMRIVLEHEPGIGGVLMLACPTAVTPAMASATAFADCVAAGKPRIPVLSCWIGDETARAARRMLRERGLAAYETVTQAVRAFVQLVDYRQSQRLLMETPPSVPEALEIDTAAARAVLQRSVGAGDERWLSEADAKAVLEAYGIAAVPTHVVGSPAEAARKAEEIGGSVALKVHSPDISHKSDVGGVMLNLAGAERVEAEAERMLARIREALPEARIDGFTVQPMVERPGAYELIVGMDRDSQFGAVLMFGEGGTAVEVLRDNALGLPPLNMRLAMDMISRTRVYRRLRGYRDRPGVDLDAVAMTLLRLSQLVVDFPEIDSLDVNPLLADQQGVIALDARIRVRACTLDDRLAHLAIRPYPKELEEPITLKDGRQMLLREHHVRGLRSEDAVADHADDVVDGLFHRGGIVQRKAVHVEDHVAVVGDEVRPQFRMAAQVPQGPRHQTARHGNDFDRERVGAEHVDHLARIDDADELLGRGRHDLLAGERAAAALDHLPRPVHLVRAVDVEQHAGRRIEFDHGDAVRLQACRAGRAAGHRGVEPVAHAGERVDEVVRRGAGADADDAVPRQARLDVGERCFGGTALQLLLVHTTGRFFPGCGSRRDSARGPVTRR